SPTRPSPRAGTRAGWWPGSWPRWCCSASAAGTSRTARSTPSRWAAWRPSSRPRSGSSCTPCEWDGAIGGTARDAPCRHLLSMGSEMGTEPEQQAGLARETAPEIRVEPYATGDAQAVLRLAQQCAAQPGEQIGAPLWQSRDELTSELATWKVAPARSL